MRKTVLAALAATAALVTPADATLTAPVNGSCTITLVSAGSPFPTAVVTAYATTVGPAYEVGVACWITSGGHGYANASNPGFATASAGAGTVYRLDYTFCEQHWALFVDGTSYFSTPVCR